jgi:hypothetical protein
VMRPGAPHKGAVDIEENQGPVQVLMVAGGKPRTVTAAPGFLVDTIVLCPNPRFA